MSRTLIVPVATACAVLAACGSPTTTGLSVPANPQAALLAAVHTTSGTSFSGDVTENATITVTGPAASQLGGFGASLVSHIHVDQASAQRSRASTSLQVAGRTIDVDSVVYDGTIYVSTDSGASYRSMPVSPGWLDRFGSGASLGLLRLLGSVSYEGSGTVDGTAVQRYHATLDPARADNYVRQELSGLGSSRLSEVLQNVRFVDGHLDADVDAQGHMRWDTGAMDVAIDLGSLVPMDAGTVMTVHLTLSGDFRDYGAHIVVTRPTHVTGAAAV